LCHLWFNITGILIWFPAPVMRKVPVGAARLLGLYASYYRATPPLYILVMFVITPLIFLGVSAVIDASVAGGIILLLFVLIVVGCLIFLWSYGFPLQDAEGTKGANALCYKVLSKEQRLAGAAALAKANAELYGDALADDPNANQKGSAIDANVNADEASEQKRSAIDANVNADEAAEQKRSAIDANVNADETAGETHLQWF